MEILRKAQDDNSVARHNHAHKQKNSTGGIIQGSTRYQETRLGVDNSPIVKDKKTRFKCSPAAHNFSPRPTRVATRTAVNLTKYTKETNMLGCVLQSRGRLVHQGNG
jgi:hypothetical protein